jgi:DNA end-binding protein Ku
VAALARYASRGKQQLVLLREADGGLIMHTLYYADEVRALADIDHGEGVKVKEGELDLAVQLIAQLASDEFHPEKYEDEYRKRALALIEQKVAGQEIVAPPGEPPKGQIIDLMEALKASLAGGDAERRGAKASGADRERKPPRKKTGGRKAKRAASST